MEERQLGLNKEIRLYRWEDERSDQWLVEAHGVSGYSLDTLRGLDEIDMLLLRLSRSLGYVRVDMTAGDDMVTPEKEPEATFS